MVSLNIDSPDDKFDNEVFDHACDIFNTDSPTDQELLEAEEDLLNKYEGDDYV